METLTYGGTETVAQSAVNAAGRGNNNTILDQKRQQIETAR